MLTPNLTHKSHKITTLTITDSYKQLFVLITVLLTVLSLQPTLTLTMASPLVPHRYQQHYRVHQQQMLQHLQLHELLAERQQRYDHQHNNNYINNNYHQQQQQQIETDLNRNFKKSKANGHEEKEDRLHKRETSWHDYYNGIMQSQAINWYNPCGGISLTNDIPVKRKRPPPIKKELRKLQSTIAKNYNFIKNKLHTINIQDMNQMELFEKKYSFLPKLSVNSSISLRRWHRQLQVYISAFEYLRRAELHFNNIKTSQESAIAKELKELMMDARNLLCNIEHAINNTTTRRGFLTIDSLFISRTKMENILNFTTDIKYVSPLRWNQIKDDITLKLVNPIDLKFAKSNYYGFVRKLLKILRTSTKKPGPLYLGRKTNKMQKRFELQEQKGQREQQLNSRNQQKKEQKQQRKNHQQKHNRDEQQKKQKNSQTANQLKHSRNKLKLESVLKS